MLLYSAFPPNLSILLANICGISGGISLGGLTLGEHFTGVREENGKLMIDNKYFYFLDNLGKTIRMPELISGIGFTGKSVFDLYNSFANNDSSSLSEGLENLSLGISLVSNSSAWYIRDSNPKVLDKKSLLKQASEKIKSYLPQLQPEVKPLPVKTNLQKHLKVNNLFY